MGLKQSISPGGAQSSKTLTLSIDNPMAPG